MGIQKDNFGPEYVVKVYDSKIGMEGFLVVDNTVLGPGKGGIRMTSSVTENEVWRLARTMTWKNALAEIPFGGAKAGIVWPGGSDDLKKQYVQSFAKAIKFFTPRKYIAGPDINTGEKEMQWFVEATGNWYSATGKPADYCIEEGGHKKCGIPHELGSTGFGVAQAARVAAEIIGLAGKATAAIHGFGNVGAFTYRYLVKAGIKVIALADTSATIYDSNGLDAKILSQLIQERKPLSQYPKSYHIPPEKFWSLPVDILIPASITDIINKNNKDAIKAKIIVEGANIPMREAVEEELFQRGMLIVPDFIANAGGVIASYAEYQGCSLKKMFDLVKQKTAKVTKAVLEESVKTNKNPREVALRLAKARIEEKMRK